MPMSNGYLVQHGKDLDQFDIIILSWWQSNYAVQKVAAAGTNMHGKYLFQF